MKHKQTRWLMLILLLIGLVFILTSCGNGIKLSKPSRMVLRDTSSGKEIEVTSNNEIYQKLYELIGENPWKDGKGYDSASGYLTYYFMTYPDTISQQIEWYYDKPISLPKYDNPDGITGIVFGLEQDACGFIYESNPDYRSSTAYVFQPTAELIEYCRKVLEEYK